MLNESHDKSLRSLVKVLGTLLGTVLRTQEGEQIFGAVETLRQGYISLRNEDNPAERERLNNLIENLDASSLTHVVRAFSIYFNLVNIAEETHHHFRRHESSIDHGPDWVGSFEVTLKELKESGFTLDQLQ